MEMNFDPKKLDSNDIDPKEKKREEKQTRRKRWYRTLCGMAAVVVMCTVYTLMLPALTLTDDQDSSSAAPSGNAVSSEITADSSSGNDSSASDKDSSDTDNSDTDSSASSASETDNNAADKNDSKTDSSDADHSKNDSDSDTDNSSTGEPADSSTAPSQPSDTDSASDTNSDADPDIENGNTVGTIEGTSDGEPDQITDEDPENTDNDNDASDDTDTDDESRSDDTADVETEADWIATLHDAISADDWDDLTWGEKLLAVAETQLGYTESILNFRTDNDGNHKGYTRYGAWYGNPYGDWCAMFVSFCLNYAGIDADAIPQDANCSNWVKELEKLNIYEDKDLYVPEPGDIVFFDQDDSGHANHVGIISEVEYGTKTVTRHITKDGSAVEDSTINLLKYINEINSTDDDASGDTQTAELETVEVEVKIAESIKVIEGNSSDRVQYVEYEVAEDKVLGYVSLENAKNVFENNGEEQKEEISANTINQTADIEGSDFTVTASYDESAFEVPVTLKAKELKEKSDSYEENYDKVVNALVQSSGVEDVEALQVSAVKLFDISFVDGNGNRIEPTSESEVKVTVNFNDSKDLTVKEDQAVNAVHIMSNDFIEVIDIDAEINEDNEVEKLEFTQSSFSVTGVVITDESATKYVRATNVSSLEMGKAYIIYTGTIALGANVSNTTSFDVENSNGANEYDIKAEKSKVVLWYYDGSKLYTTISGTKYYLSGSNRLNSYTLSVGTSGNEVTYSNGNLKMKVGSKNPSLNYNNSWSLKTSSDTSVSIAEVTSIDVIAPGNYTLSIKDDVVSSGCIKPVISQTDGETGIEYEIELASGQKFVWYKCINDSDEWSVVERRKASGDYYNTTENGNELNIALDGGALNSTQTSVKYRVKLVNSSGNVITDSQGKEIVSEEFNVTYYDSLQNGSFEIPSNDENGKGEFQYQYSNYEYLKYGGVWQTTGVGTGSQVGHDIEILRPINTNKDGNPYHSARTAKEGEQFAEINCEAAGALYQDVLTIPGQTLNWAFSHQARAKYTYNMYTDYDNTMMMIIMSSEDASDIVTQNDITNLISSINANEDGLTENIEKTILAYRVTNDSDNRSWHSYTSNLENAKAYTVPEGQYVTRFYFVAVSGTGNDPSIGNYIDNVYFTTKTLPPTDGKANLIFEKKIVGLTKEDFTADENGKLKLKNSLMDFKITYGYDSVEIKASDVYWEEQIDKSYLMTYSVNDIAITANSKVDFKIEEEFYNDIVGYSYVSTVLNVFDKNYSLISDELGKSGTSYLGELGENDQYTIQFVNTYTPYGFELPETGGEGTALIYLLGAAIIAAPTTVAVTRRRRKKMN